MLDSALQLQRESPGSRQIFKQYNIQLMKQGLQTNQGRLYAWGKGYPAMKQIAKEVKTMSAGENHCILITFGQDVYGLGSNKFGQLGLPQLGASDSNQIKKLNYSTGGTRLNLLSVHCGAEHTFFITDKHEVYSMGLNIKGQLGQGNFENVNRPKLVVSLLPHGTKNPKSLNPALSKQSKPPIVELLEKFDLQVKVEEEPIESILLLEQEEFVVDIACGALFTIALTNKGKIYGCGYQGSSLPAGGAATEEYIDKAKFKRIDIEGKVSAISGGLSGAAALTRDGTVYIWGRFGKLIHNLPKRITTKDVDDAISRHEEERFADVKLGDEFIVLLSVKGEVYSFGENIDNQLGCDNDNVTFRPQPQKMNNVPLFKAIFVGRNHCLAISGNNELYGWGSNRYNQIGVSDAYSITMKPRNLQVLVSEFAKLCPSSYCTYLLSPQKISLSASSPEKMSTSARPQQTVKLSQFKKLLQDYQVLKSLNLALLEKTQQGKKVSQETQTVSKFDIDGVTKFRQFGSNVEIEWSELQLVDRINEGGYGIIYKAKWRQIFVVVKKFKIENGDVSLRDFLSECNAMEAVRHPYIVMFLGAVTKSKNYSIILEYCDRGSLWSYLQNQENTISWEDRKRFAMEIAQGVLYLHSCTPPILHRDLKSLNIFLDKHLTIKIGDFGWTKTLEEYMTNKIGTYQWMAPEVIGNKPYTEKADVFSYSIILWEIASRQPPYRNITGAKVSEAVLYNDLRPQIPKKTPEPFARLMRKCWDSDPLKRPTFKEIIRELEMMKL